MTNLRFSLRPGFYLFLALLVLVGGCQKFKKLRVKPPEGVEQESYSIRLAGYTQTVTVKAGQEELFNFMSDPSSWFTLTDMEMAGTEPGKIEPMTTGDVFPFRIQKLGLEISGRMIVAKSEADQLWYLWENPVLLQVQRWEFKPAEEGCRLTIRVETEEPRKLSPLVELAEEMGIMEQIYGEIDLMLAGIQAHFDPGLRPQDLVAMGLRGESYESIFQVYEGSIWVQANPEEIFEWLLEDPDHIELCMPDMRVTADCLQSEIFSPRSSDQVGFCPAKYKVAGVPIVVEAFSTNRVEPDKRIYNIYLLAAGQILRLQILCQPEAAGSRLTIQVLTELPTGLTSDSMDAMMVLLEIPKTLNQALITIKNNLEARE